MLPHPHHPPIPPTQPTHTFPCIPTHIPQCLSCYFTKPTPPHPGPHTPPHTSNPWIPTHPCPTLYLNIFKVKGVVGLKIFYIPPEKCLHPPHATSPKPSHTSLHIFLNVCHITSHHPPHTTHHPISPTHSTSPTHSHTPTHPHIPMHPYTYPPMFVMLLHTTYPTPPHPGPHTPHHTNNPQIPTHPCPTLHLNIFQV